MRTICVDADGLVVRERPASARRLKRGVRSGRASRSDFGAGPSRSPAHLIRSRRQNRAESARLRRPVPLNEPYPPRSVWSAPGARTKRGVCTSEMPPVPSSSRAEQDRQCRSARENRVISLLYDLDWKNREVARELGVNQNRVSQIKTRNSTRPGRRALRLARLVGLDLVRRRGRPVLSFTFPGTLRPFWGASGLVSMPCLGVTLTRCSARRLLKLRPRPFESVAVKTAQ